MDLELSKYMQTAAKAWEAWRRSKKTPTDALALGVAASSVAARAKILWQSNPNYPQVFTDIADIALDVWQSIIDNVFSVTAKDFGDALVRTAIVEKTRDRLEKEGYVDESPWSQAIWLNLSKVSPALMLYAWASGKIGAQDVVNDVQGTVRRIQALAGGGGNLLVTLAVGVAGVYLLGKFIERR